MKKKMHLVDLHGLEDTVGSGIQSLMVFGHMSFIMIMSKARVQFFISTSILSYEQI